MKKSELFIELEDRGIKFNKGLTKDRIISKLMKYEETKNDTNDWKQKLKAYLQPTVQLSEGEFPTITKRYRDTFNNVDIFDRLLYCIGLTDAEVITSSRFITPLS